MIPLQVFHRECSHRMLYRFRTGECSTGNVPRGRYYTDDSILGNVPQGMFLHGISLMHIEVRLTCSALSCYVNCLNQ
jgi:hypothetical protein